jgi:hypothetical protein
VKIFVAYSFNERDKWIEELVFPIIEAFGSQVVTGGVTYEGPNIPENVMTKIRRSDALIGFTTRRDLQDNMVSRTHQWVISELSAAFALDRRVVEVRERGIDPQGALYQDLQRIEYDERARDKCMVDIVRAVGSWHQTDTVRIQLLPEDVTHALRPLLDEPGLSCKYTVRTGSQDEDPRDAQIVPITGGLFIDAASVPRDALIRISVRYGDQRWSSDYESIEAYRVSLR